MQSFVRATLPVIMVSFGATAALASLYYPDIIDNMRNLELLMR